MSWAVPLSHDKGQTSKFQMQCPTKCPTFFLLQLASMQQKTWHLHRAFNNLSPSKGNFFITWSCGGIREMRLNSFVSQWPHTYTVCIQGLHAGGIQLLSWLDTSVVGEWFDEDKRTNTIKDTSSVRKIGLRHAAGVIRLLFPIGHLLMWLKCGQVRTEVRTSNRHMFEQEWTTSVGFTDYSTISIYANVENKTLCSTSKSTMTHRQKPDWKSSFFSCNYDL